jgi:hypothetical protein
MPTEKPLSFQETPLRKTSAALQPAKVFGMGDPLATKLFGKLDNAALNYLEPITQAPVKPDLSGPIPGSYDDLVKKGWVKPQQQMAKGGRVKKYAEGGYVRGDGCCKRGKTKGKMR